MPSVTHVDELGQRELRGLAEAARSAESAYPKNLPPCGPTVKGLCEPPTHNGIGLLAGTRVARQGDALPAATHGHGEAVRGAWIAADGTEFLAGYMYTGVPGPDTGVVYRRDAQGDAWRMVWTKRANEVGHLWGTSSKDVWVTGVRTLAHWDGTAWTEEAIPGLDGNVSGVWGTDRELFVVGGDFADDTDGGRIWVRDAKGTWSLEARAPKYLFGVHGAGKTVVAVGNDGVIMRRVRPGTWTNEGVGRGQNTSVWLASPTEMYVAGSGLLHSKGDGNWERVRLPNTSQVRTVWGRSSRDVYAGTQGGLLHWDGKTWSATEWTRACGALAGNAEAVLVVDTY